jgi:hypothetical protein
LWSAHEQARHRRLIPRLIEADAGRIMFDGVDVRALGTRSLRAPPAARMGNCIRA